MIFGKREPVATGRTEPDASSVTPALREKISQVQERRIQHSILSADLQITGDVVSSGDITIEGAVDGNHLAVEPVERAEPETAPPRQFAKRHVALVEAVQQRVDRRILEQRRRRFLGPRR